MSTIRVCIFLIFPLLIASALWAEEIFTFTSSEDGDGQAGLIRQVVDGDDHDHDDESWMMVRNPHRLSDEHRFSIFKAKFNKSYVSKEEQYFRFQLFRSNLKQAARNQKLDPTAIHGVTQFSDLTEDEFREQFLGLRGLELPVDTEKGPYLPTDKLPDKFDWRDKKAVTAVKDQGTCRSCWSFSAIGALEGAHFLANKKLVNLSAQQLVDCDGGNRGCISGLMTTACQYIKDAGGVMSEEDYPYTAQPGQCKFNENKIAAKIASFSILPQDPNQFAAYLVKNGPLSVGLNSTPLKSYMRGVTCPSNCPTMPDHGALLVGYEEATTTDKSHWIIKNSWGEDFGEEGYFRICKGSNVCAIESTEAVTVTAAEL